MRILITIVLGLIFASNAWPSDPSAPIDFEEPPFWMPTFDEIQPLPLEIKDFYITNLMPLAQRANALTQIKKTQLLEATEWAEGWNAIQMKFYRACRDEDSMKDVCEQAADLRVKMFEMGSSRRTSAENSGPVKKREDATKPTSVLPAAKSPPAAPVAPKSK